MRRRVLVEWLVEQAEELTRTAHAEDADRAVTWLCRRGRAVAHFVRLWCLEPARAPPVSWRPPNGSPGPCPIRISTLAI